MVVVEDLISTGGSSLKAVEALREAGASVKGMVAIFTYGFAISEENFQNANVSLHTLSDYHNVLEQAEKSRYISAKETATLSQWRKNPSEWP